MKVFWGAMQSKLTVIKKLGNRPLIAGDGHDKNAQSNNWDRDRRKYFFSQPVISLWKSQLQRVEGKNIIRFQKGLEMYIDVINYNSGYIS